MFTAEPGDFRRAGKGRLAPGLTVPSAGPPAWRLARRPFGGNLAPPLIDGVTLAEQGGALVAGKVLPGVEAFFGYRRQQRPAGDDRFGKFAAQAAPAGFLLGELVDDDERDVFGDGARDR